jgi:hypothetical protein
MQSSLQNISLFNIISVHKTNLSSSSKFKKEQSKKYFSFYIECTNPIQGKQWSDYIKLSKSPNFDISLSKIAANDSLTSILLFNNRK